LLGTNEKTVMIELADVCVDILLSYNSISHIASGTLHVTKKWGTVTVIALCEGSAITYRVGRVCYRSC